VSTFERGGDVTLSTFLKLAQALDVELIPVPQEDMERLNRFSRRNAGGTLSAPFSLYPSLLDRYQ